MENSETFLRAKGQTLREAINFMLLSLDDESLYVEDLADLKNGVTLLRLVEHYEGFPVGDFDQGNDEATCKKNMDKLMKYLGQCGIRVFGITSESLANGSVKSITELCWKVFLRYFALKASIDVEEEEKDKQWQKKFGKQILSWVNTKLKQSDYYEGKPQTSFKNFSSGLYLCYVADAMRPGCIKSIGKLKAEHAEDNIELALTAAEEHFGAPRTLASQFVANGYVDDQMFIATLTFWKNFEEVVYAKASHAYEGGIREGDELLFNAGEIIEVLNSSSDWWKGRLKGKKVGFFPASYVELCSNHQQFYLREAAGDDKGYGADMPTLEEELDAAHDKIEALEGKLAILSARRSTGKNGAAAAVPASTKQVEQLKRVVERERNKRNVLQKNLEAERRRKHTDRKEIESMRKAFMAWEEKERKREEEEVKRAAVLEDLIANSEMLPDMMLAATKLEMEIDRIELENQEMKDEMDRQRKEQIRSEKLLKEQERAKAQEELNREIQKTGDNLAQKMQTEMEAEREEFRKEIAGLQQQLARQGKEHEQAEAKLKEDAKLLNALVKSLKKKIADHKTQVEEEAAAKQNLQKEIQTLQSSIPAQEEYFESEMERHKEESELRLDQILQQAEMEKEEIISIHAEHRRQLETEVNALKEEIEKREGLVREEKDKLSKAVREFDLHKIVAHNKEAAAAKKHLSNLKRLKAAEESHDSTTELLEETQQQWFSLLTQTLKANGEEAKLADQIKQEEGRIQEREEYWEDREKMSQELDVEIEKAQEELERLHQRALEDRERREKLEALEKSRLQAEEERSRHQRFGIDRNVRTEADRRFDHPEAVTTASLVAKFKKAHANAAVQIFSTDQPDIYIFGTRKIHVQVLNGQLMVRVGGGWDPIENFVESHAPREARKLNHTLERKIERELKEVQEANEINRIREEANPYRKRANTHSNAPPAPTAPSRGSKTPRGTKTPRSTKTPRGSGSRTARNTKSKGRTKSGAGFRTTR